MRASSTARKISCQSSCAQVRSQIFTIVLKFGRGSSPKTFTYSLILHLQSISMPSTPDWSALKRLNDPTGKLKSHGATSSSRG